jgi:predicted nucleic acid-binding protein
VIVVDASAVVAVLAVDAAVPGLRDRLDNDELHAPHLVDIELLHALRRMVNTGQMNAQRAEVARVHFGELALTRYPHHPLASRIWELRQNVTAYDAAYVALSEALDVPLITCDARLAASTGHHARIELFTA